MTKHTPTKRNLAVITGADGGMGREITLAVAAKGYTVVMVCQNEEKAEPKRREIVACTGNKSVEIMTADFCSLASVGRLADRLLQRNESIDLLMNNAGTLDPLATGVLLVCIGRATKMVDALQAEEKEYVADVMLGATTPSYDLEHPVDATFPTQHITRGKVLEALAALSGERLQSPPVYSAKKIDGMRVPGLWNQYRGDRTEKFFFQQSVWRLSDLLWTGIQDGV